MNTPKRQLKKNPQRIPDPMLPTFKEWRHEIAEARGINPESVYMRLVRGNHPEVEIVRINHQRQFVKPTNHQPKKDHR